MLDATFLKPAMRHLSAARQIRRDLPKLKVQIARYHHISPADKAREVERMKERHRLHVAYARHYTAKGKLYSHGDELLRAAGFVHEPLAGYLRDKARQAFDRADSLPPPPL